MDGASCYSMDVGRDQEDCTKRYVRTQGEVQRRQGNSDAELPLDDGKREKGEIYERVGGA